MQGWAGETRAKVSYVLGRRFLPAGRRNLRRTQRHFCASILRTFSLKATPSSHLLRRASRWRTFDFALVTEEYSRKTRHGDRGVGMGVGSMDTLKGYWSRPWKRQIPPVKMKGEGLKGERKQVGSFRRKRCFVPSTSGVGFDPRRCQAALEDHRRFSSSPAPLCRHQRSKHDA